MSTLRDFVFQCPTAASGCKKPSSFDVRILPLILDKYENLTSPSYATQIFHFTANHASSWFHQELSSWSNNSFSAFQFKQFVHGETETQRITRSAPIVVTRKEVCVIGDSYFMPRCIKIIIQLEKRIRVTLSQKFVWRRSDIRLSISDPLYTAGMRAVPIHGSEAWLLRVPAVPRLSLFEHHCLPITGRIY